MIAAPRRFRMPLFLRIFALMLACVATAQVVNFLMIVTIGVPVPQIYTVDQVATALRRGSDPLGRLSVADAATTPISTMPRDQMSRTVLANTLAVPRARVEVFRFIPLGSVLGPLIDERRASAVGDLEAARFLFGDFQVAVRHHSRWRVVRPAQRELAHWGWRALLVLLAALAVVAPFAWWLSRRVARPIAMFAAAADRLGRSFRAAPIPATGPPEIADAAAVFNRMQSRLERFVEDRGLLIAAIAHDMRTPLMRLSLRLAAVPEAMREAVERDIADMDAMIVAATAFIRDVREPASRRALDLRSLIDSLTDELADRGERVTLAPGDPLVIEADAPGLRALVSNLIGNALKYAGDAEVTLFRDGDEAVIEVRDHGPGIAAADLDRVFEPFYRGEPSRNRDTGGIGLGLASVRAVAQAHGGDATIANHRDGGAVARVILPL